MSIAESLGKEIGPMGKVIILDDHFIKSEGMTFRQMRGMRAYARFKADHHRRLEEAAKKREDAGQE